MVIYNKNILKPINQFIYYCSLLFYKLNSVLTYPFQRFFINVYTVLLQTNRLPFRIIPQSIKFILVYFVDIESWILFFKRITNKTNLYVIRIKKYPVLHRLWCIYFRNKSIYHSELNIKRAYSEDISNFYYNTRIVDKFDLPVPLKNTTLLLYFYLNKVSLTNYPYLYHTYWYAYNKYQYHKKPTNASQHLRTHLFFLMLELVYKFKRQNFTHSFIKLDFFTFRGISQTVRYIAFAKEVRLAPQIQIKNTRILTPLEEKLTLLEKNIYKKYINTFHIKPDYKFYINNIVAYNFYNFVKVTSPSFLNNFSKLTLTWYNKLHNTIFETQKRTIILYLRAAKHFNKGRYSRNRQLYRTGVYWCIWLNVVIVYALHFYFYRVVFTFGYLWWPLGLMVLSIFSSRLYKYRYYNINQLIVEFKEYNTFIFYLYLKVKNILVRVCATLYNTFIHFFSNYILLLNKFFESKIERIVTWFKRIFF